MACPQQVIPVILDKHYYKASERTGGEPMEEVTETPVADETEETTEVETPETPETEEEVVDEVEATEE